jgi:hypothetical protein
MISFRLLSFNGEKLYIGTIIVKRVREKQLSRKRNKKSTHYLFTSSLFRRGHKTQTCKRLHPYYLYSNFFSHNGSYGKVELADSYEKSG